MPEPLDSDHGLLHQTVNALTDHAFVVLDGAQCVRFWSTGAEAMFGRSAADTLGLPLDRLFGADKRCWELPSDHGDGSSADVRLSKRCWFTLPDGSQRYLLTTATQLRDKSACVGFALHAHDLAPDRISSDGSSESSPAVDERVSALSDQLGEMTAQLEAARAERAKSDWVHIRQLREIVASQEDERRQIARDLRDHLGQQVTALQLAVEALQSDHSLWSQGIKNSLELIAGIGRGLDSIAWELRPASLDDLGLSAVLRTYLQQWSHHSGVRGTFHCGPLESERFPPEVEATLYRIARAALDTIAQSGARSVDVILERRETNAVLVVEDDAVAGFSSSDRTGLARMEERAAALGGIVEIEPAPGGGTTVVARVPLLASAYAGQVATALPQVSAMDDPVSTAVAPDGDTPVATVNLLRARLAELRNAVAARDEFVATVAHELRNPVAPLIFQIRLAIQKTEQLAEARAHVAPDWVQSQFLRVEQRLHRLLETLDRLLDVSRMSTGRVDLQPEPVNLVHAVREIVGSFEAELGVAGCALTTEERCAPTGLWDRIRLEQICRNLLSNAIRFGAGSPIHVSIDADTDFAILRVRDHGVGITPAQQARMFERFERGSEQRSGGFGIGLWVVKNICAAMGGTISVESTLGEGACFTVMLPCYAFGSADHAHSDGLQHGTQ